MSQYLLNYGGVYARNGSRLVTVNSTNFVINYGNYMVFLPDESNGRVNTANSTLFTVSDDHLFEFIFLVVGLILLLGLFFFIAVMFCCRRSYKEVELDAYEAATNEARASAGDNNDNTGVKLRADSFRASQAAQGQNSLNGSRRGSFNGMPNNNGGTLSHPSSFLRQQQQQQQQQPGSRRGSFNGMPNNGGNMNRQGSFSQQPMQPGSRRGSFNGMPNNGGNMSRQGSFQNSQRRQSYPLEF